MPEGDVLPRLGDWSDVKEEEMRTIACVSTLIPFFSLLLLPCARDAHSYRETPASAMAQSVSESVSRVGDWRQDGSTMAAVLDARLHA